MKKKSDNVNLIHQIYKQIDEKARNEKAEEKIRLQQKQTYNTIKIVFRILILGRVVFVYTNVSNPNRRAWIFVFINQDLFIFYLNLLLNAGTSKHFPIYQSYCFMFWPLS